jgi:hypothetical protein|tara:strand:+ start:813 stop:1013 length:201 start_codon:yes stop_codon:yes gene_type:complete
MKDLHKFEEMFMIFASSLDQFGSEIEQARFKDEVGMVSWSTSNKLKDLYTEIEAEINRLKEYQKIK